MPRGLRQWYPGASYHITSRGNRRADLFYDDKDRYKYLELLDETSIIYPFHLHSFCLMTNHTHLLIETITDHIKEIMKMLNTRYAIYFNHRHQLDGHVFQGRYHSELIDSLQYFLEASRYIHLNPVAANMVASPEEYRWSSYRYFLQENTCPNPSYLTTDKILKYFPEPKKTNYIKFVEEIRKETETGNVTL